MGKESSNFLPIRAHSRAGSGGVEISPSLDELQEETVAYLDEAHVDVAAPGGLMSPPVATQRGAPRARAQVISPTMTANQVVAYNMAKARALRGWTQERTGEELAPYVGVKLSNQTISIMESSARQSGRIRVFSADDLLALSRGFDLPLGFFLVPPGAIRLRSATTDEDPLVLVDAVLGTPENLAEWEQALFEWSAASAPTPAPRWLRAHVARSASAFGGHVELAQQCRRMVRVLEDLDVVCPSDMQG